MNDKKSKLDLLTPKITWWVGSPSSMVLHTLFFATMLGLILFDFNTTNILLILTTVVSLEAIYLAIFIQYSINQQARVITEVAEDIGEVTEDVEEISKDVDEISEDVEELSGDIDSLQTEAEEENLSDTETYARMEQQINLILKELETLKSRDAQKKETL